MVNVYNKNTNSWLDFEPMEVTFEQIQEIVGQVPIEIKSDGYIIIDKELTNEEKTQIENLYQ